MQDHELYRRILGIEAPRQVERVELQLPQGEVRVSLGHKNKAECKQVTSMLKRRFENIMNYSRHRITNAASESLNAKIRWVKYTARGFRNKQNFIHAIYFHCGSLDLAPSSTE